MRQDRNIESITIEELFKQSVNASIPILIDIQHDDIKWEDNEQENGHLRLINDSTAVRYENHTYLPAIFSFTMPEENGQKIGNTSVTVSAIDKRIVEIIRSINSKARCTFMAFFAKQDASYYFSKLYNYEFEMDSVTWNGITAQWNLVFDPVMQLNVPRDLGTISRFPSVSQN